MVTIDLPAFVAADRSYDLGSGDATCFFHVYAVVGLCLILPCTILKMPFCWLVSI